jgi:hypothetical protein
MHSSSRMGESEKAQRSADRMPYLLSGLAGHLAALQEVANRLLCVSSV